MTEYARHIYRYLQALGHLEDTRQIPAAIAGILNDCRPDGVNPNLTLSGIQQDAIDVLLAGPDQPTYWSIWKTTLAELRATDTEGQQWRLVQCADGEVWAVRVDTPAEILAELPPLATGDTAPGET